MFARAITAANSLRQTLGFITKHPVSSRAPGRAIARWLRWQVGSRIMPGDVIVPFMGDAKLVMRRGMVGATGNWYAGLHEFEDMGFLLHLLQPDDLFVDVGANVGSYTVLASAVCGARSLAIEPLPATFASLMQNVAVNRISNRVEVANVGVGSSAAVLRFTASLDTVNHVVAPGEDFAGPTVQVPVTTLDSLLAGRNPVLWKVDVEGFESEVLAGATQALREPSLLAIIIEMNDSAAVYGRARAESVDVLTEAGFASYAYSPFDRRLSPAAPVDQPSGNLLFLREVDAVSARLRSAPRRNVAGVDV
jgi:FkbM family methyltransferase